VSTTFKQKPRKQEDSVIYTQRIKDTIQDYDAVGLIYIIQKDDRQEMAYEDAARARPDTVQEFVTSIYRVKTQKRFVINQASDEAIVYYKRRSALQYNNEAIEDHRYWGYRMKPVTVDILDEHGRIKKVDKRGETPYFTIPYDPKNVDEIIRGSLTEPDQFYIANSTTQGPEAISRRDIYQILNKDDFKEGSFSELWDMGRLNYTYKEPYLRQWRKDGPEILKQAKSYKTISTSNI